MTFLGIFGKPDVYKLERKRRIKGLIRALGYEKDVSIQRKAAEALGVVGDSRALEALSEIVKNPSTGPILSWRATIAVGKIDAREKTHCLTELASQNQSGFLKQLLEILQYTHLKDVHEPAKSALRSILLDKGAEFLVTTINNHSNVHLRLLSYSLIEQQYPDWLSKVDKQHVIETTVARIRILYAKTRTQTVRHPIGYETEARTHTTEEWVELPVGSPGHYGWVEVIHSEEVKVPKYRYSEKTVHDPDLASIETIIKMIPSTLYEEIANLSGEAASYFKE